MATAQLNIRLSPAQRARVERNARLLGKKPTDYVRDLIDKDDYMDGAELTRSLRAYARSHPKPLVSKK